MRFSDEHLPWGQKARDDPKLRVVEMKLFAVQLPVHVRIGQEDLGRAAFRDDLQHAGFFQLLDGLRRQNHGRIVLAPGLLRFDDVVADGGVLDEQPRLVQKKRLEGGEPFGVDDLVRGAVKNVKQQRFEHVGSAGESFEVERLKGLEGKRVRDVIKYISVLAVLGPLMQPLFQLADDRGKRGYRALTGIDDVHVLDGIVELAVFLEVHLVAALVAFDQHSEKRKQKVQVFLRWWQGKRIDSEVL